MSGKKYYCFLHLNM